MALRCLLVGDGLGVACVDDQFYVLGGESLNWFFSLYTGTTRYNINEMYTPLGYGSVPPKVSFLSAMNQTYNVSSVPVNFTVNRAINWTGYSLDGQPVVTIDGNTTIGNVTNGVHWLTVYVNDTFGNYVTSQALNFTVAMPAGPFSNFGFCCCYLNSGSSDCSNRNNCLPKAEESLQATEELVKNL